MEDNKQAIIPFGKYKGQPVGAIANDKNYVNWLVSQNWFKQKFENIYTIIINNFTEPTETPEHNQMQVKFLNNVYCLKVAYLIYGDALFKISLNSIHNEFVKNIKRLPERVRRDFFKSFQKGIESAIEDLGRELIYTKVTFEKGGVDVELSVSYGPLISTHVEVEEWSHSIRTPWPHVFFLELKPTIGDDFPAVLRQIKNFNIETYGLSTTDVLLIFRQYTGSGATQQEFLDYFKSQGIAVVFESDIEKTILPNFDKTLDINFEQLGFNISNNAT